MKSLTLLIASAALISTAGEIHAAVLWQQDFDASPLVSGYVGSGAGQLDAVSSSGAGLSWSIQDGAIQGIRSGNTGSLTINGDDFATPLLLVELRFQVSTILAGATTSVMFAAGSSFGTGNTHPDNDVTHSDFSINFTTGTPGSLRFRDHDNTTNLGNATDGTDAIAAGQWVDLWWGINNSGSDLAYTRPDGSTATLQDDRWDLWTKIGGSWHQIGNNPSNVNNTGGILDDFKITFTRGEGTILFDSIRLSDAIEVVPEPSSILLAATSFASVLPHRKRRALR